ncbi:MAG: 30S ribosomal protein S5 [Candidatus Tyloplasma litorale]|nr:MAG: 30S ribosomal protein S5 [Mycoplasmatales bacterium]
MFFNEEKIENNEAMVDNPSTVKKPSKNTPDTSEPIAKEFLPGNFNPFARPVNPRFANAQKREKKYEERVLKIKRVIKVTKGGRRFKFSALVVIGDKKGKVGYGVGKHIEVPEAIKKAIKAAEKNLINVKIDGENATVPHNVIGHKGAAKVMLKPAAEGKGIIASDVVRSVVELAGYRNIYSKNLGTNNPNNVILATIDGLSRMRTGEEIKGLKKEIIFRKNPKFNPNKKRVEQNPNQNSTNEGKGE